MTKSSLLRNLELFWALSKREVASRFKGSYGGLSWYVVQNLLLLTLYSFVFGTLFKNRWSSGDHIQGNFTVALFIGLIVFNTFAECITRAPTLILANANYVKKVVFPLEVLPAVSLATALFNALIAFLVLIVVAFVLKAPLHWEGLWIPVIMIPLVVLTLGVGWFLAALGTYIRDINQMVTLLISAFMFLSPLFYQITALPKKVQTWVMFNPLTIPMQESRAALMFGETPDFGLLSLYLAVAVVVAISGYAFFQKARGGFADVL